MAADPGGEGSRWDPVLYQQFRRERARPFFDLLARVPDEGEVRLVADLGCGTAELTAHLASRWPRARVWGVDSSREMIERARSAGSLPAGLELVCEDLQAWEPPAPLDLIVSNAVLHWMPDHASLLSRLAAWLAPGGVLAVQVPRNRAERVYALVEEEAARPPWAGLLRQAARPRVESPGWYMDRLQDLGLGVELWETIYHHRLEGPDAVLRWISGSTLRPMLSALDPASTGVFLEGLGRRVREAYPPGPHGVLFPFRRLLFVARLP